MREDDKALAETVASAEPDSRAADASGAPEEPSLTGTSIDHFEIHERLGRGGMGEVYAATDHSLERAVAIKVLRSEVTRQPGMTERFLREARAQARFNHPNIVHIYYIGRRPEGGQEDSLFFAMERLYGGDLQERLPAGETMGAEEGRDAMMQVARGLRAAHRVGVIHRDIKPSNLMIDEEGVLKIADFGLAKPIDGDNEITQEGALVGSPYYMAPEQAVGDAIDHRADMYAMGAAFYHLLSGRPPFEGPRPMVVVAKHLSEALPPLAKTAPHVPPALARIVERLLAKKPDDRYGDYDALLGDLEAAAPQPRAFAPFMTRAAAVLGDFLVAGLLIGFLGWVGLLVYLAIVTVGQAWRGQTPAKYLLGIEVRRDDGNKLGWGRALGRTLVSLWMPILAGGTIALTSGIPELLETIEGLDPASLAELQNVLAAMAISHGFLTILYFVGLGLAIFHAEHKTVHDLVMGSVVTYRLASREPIVKAGSMPPPRNNPSTRPPPGAPNRLECSTGSAETRAA